MSSFAESRKAAKDRVVRFCLDERRLVDCGRWATVRVQSAVASSIPKSNPELLLALVVIRMEEMRGGLLRPPTTGAATIGPLGIVKEEAEPSGRMAESLRGVSTPE